MMKYIITPLIGLTLAIISAILAPIVMLLAVWFIKWDKEPTTGSWGLNPTIRGDLPYLLRWFQTPDERFPGGLYEPTVQKWLDTKGKRYCSYMWAGMRNQMMGLAAALGRPATDYIPESPMGMWKRDDIWRYSRMLGSFRFVCGWQVTKLASGSFLAVPVCSLKSS
jgi:hypothetical protein